MLVDSDIKVICELGNIETPGDHSGNLAIFNSDETCIGCIGYDVRSDRFYSGNKQDEKWELLPGESVFVSSIEIVHFDDCTSGIVNLKNSRIRMGLMLDSPIYHPGHTTRIYFRLTNVSNNIIKLQQGEKYAMLVFEQLDKEPKTPYRGAFKDEFDFKGLSDYTSVYSDQIKTVEDKTMSLRSLEKSVYSNVITILSIFVAVFSLVNINVGFIGTSTTISMMLAINLVTIGALSFFSLFMHHLIFSSKEKKTSEWLWVVPASCFLLAILLILIF